MTTGAVLCKITENSNSLIAPLKVVVVFLINTRFNDNDRRLQAEIFQVKPLTAESI